MSVWNGRYYGKNVSGLAKSHKSVAWGSGEVYNRDITLCRISEEADGLYTGCTADIFLHRRRILC